MLTSSIFKTSPIEYSNDTSFLSPAFAWPIEFPFNVARTYPMEWQLPKDKVASPFPLNVVAIEAMPEPEVKPYHVLVLRHMSSPPVFCFSESISHPLLVKSLSLLKSDKALSGQSISIRTLQFNILILVLWRIKCHEKLYQNSKTSYLRSMHKW